MKLLTEIVTSYWRNHLGIIYDATSKSEPKSNLLKLEDYQDLFLRQSNVYLMTISNFPLKKLYQLHQYNPVSEVTRSEYFKGLITFKISST
jgi:hypothetical protein